MKETENMALSTEVSAENRAAIAQFLRDLCDIRDEYEKILRMPRSEIGNVWDYVDEAFAWFTGKYGIARGDASSCACKAAYSLRNIAEFIEASLRE